jgi:hypothetical protein
MDSDEHSSQPQTSEVASLDTADSDNSTGDGIVSLLHATFANDAAELNNTNNAGPSNSHHDIDLESRICSEAILATVAKPIMWDTTIQSQVLKDVFHVFNMLRLLTMHGLRKEFGQALCDVLFVADKEDHMQISTWAAKLKPPKTFEQLEASQPKWVHQQCR